jgi:hypothetical protein
VYLDKPYLPLQVIQAMRLLLADRPVRASAPPVPAVAATAIALDAAEAPEAAPDPGDLPTPV